MRREFLTHVSHLSLNGVLAFLFGLGFWIVVLRVRGAAPEEVGAAVALVSLAYFVGFWALLGVNIAGQRAVAADPHRAPRLLGVGLAVAAGGVALATAVVAIAPAGLLPAVGRTGVAVLAFGALAAGAALDALAGDLLVGLRETRVLVLKNSAKLGARALGAFVVPPTWEALVFLFAATEIAANVAAAAIVVSRGRAAAAAAAAHAPAARLRDLATPVAVGFVSALVGLVPARLVPYLVARADVVAGATFFLGYLALDAARLVPSAIGSAVIPYAAGRRGDVTRLAIGAGLAVAVPAALGLALVAGPMFDFLGGAYAEEGGTFVALAAPSVVLYAVSSPIISRFWGEGRYGIVVVYTAVQLATFAVGLAVAGVGSLARVALVLDAAALASAVFCLAAWRGRPDSPRATPAPAVVEAPR